MKRYAQFIPALIVLAALLCIAGQGLPPLRVKEIDGSPSLTFVSELRLANGSLTDAGSNAAVIIDFSGITDTTDAFWITNTTAANSISNRFGAGVRIGANSVNATTIAASGALTGGSFDIGGGNFTVSGAGATEIAGTLTLASTLSLQSAAAPTTTAAQIAFDNNAWAASRGTIQLHDGTANTYGVFALASDAPSNGQVPTWNTGGTITWETPSASAAAGPFTNAYVGWGNSSGTNNILIHPGGFNVSNGVFSATVESLDFNPGGGSFTYTPTTIDMRLPSAVNIWDSTVTLHQLYVNDLVSLTLAYDSPRASANITYPLIVGSGANGDRSAATNAFQVGSVLGNNDFIFYVSTNGHTVVLSNLVVGGSISSGSGSSAAGSITMNEGTAPSLTANMFSIYSPTDVAAGGLAFVLPAAAFSGPVKVANSSGVMTISAAAFTDIQALAPSVIVTNGASTAITVSNSFAANGGISIATNANNTGTALVGYTLVTNATGNFTLAALTLPDTSSVWCFNIAVTNGSGADITITGPNGTKAAKQQGGSAPAVTYCTNLTWTEINVRALQGKFTNWNFTTH